MTYILNVKVDMEKTTEDIIKDIGKLVSNDKLHIICTTNPEFIIQAQKDEEFLNIINNCDISIPDGYGVVLAYNYMYRVSRSAIKYFKGIRYFLIGINVFFDAILNKNIKGECIRGVDLFFDICEYAEKNDKTVFLLGGRQKDFLGRNVTIDVDLASIAASKLKEKYENLRIIGATSKFSYKEKDDQDTLDHIKHCMQSTNVDHIDFLFVAYGHSNQEKWINRNAYKIPAKVSIGVGGTLDYVVYPGKRAPKIFIKYKLEWFYKLITQPWRVKRIINAFPIFPIKVYLSSLKGE